MEMQSDTESVLSESECTSDLERNELGHYSCNVPLDFEIPPLHRKQNMNSLTEEEIQELELSGVKINHGKFRKRENTLIKENFENFIQKFKPQDEFLLLGIGKPENRAELRKYRRDTFFFVRLARGLPDRTLRSVILRAKLMFHPQSYGGRFTDDEDKRLLKLQQRYGNNWPKIGSKMDRHPQAILFRFRLLKRGRTLGRWNNMEETELELSMKKELNVVSFSEISDCLHKNYPWEVIHQGVPTRNFHQCRARWMAIDAWKCKSERIPFTGEDKMKLIQLVQESSATEDCEIDFESYYEDFFSKVPSIEALRRKWFEIKITVPNYHIKSLEEILEYLDINYIPKLIIEGK